MFRITPFEEPEVISQKTAAHSLRRSTCKKGSKPPRAGDGSRRPLITMDTAFGDMPDAVWLQAHAAESAVASRSNNREVQARALRAAAPASRCCRARSAIAIAGSSRIDTRRTPPGRDTYVGYHRDLKRLARLRALLDLVIERMAG